MRELHYFIDGYNLLHALGMAPPKGASAQALHSSRDRLIQLLNDKLEAGGGRATIVFDAAGARVPAEQVTGRIRILYAVQYEEADDLLEELLAQAVDRHQTALVSNDRRLRRAASRARIIGLSCTEFLDRIESSRKPLPPTNDPSQRGMAPTKDSEDWLATFGAEELDAKLEQAFGFPEDLPKDPPSP